MFSWLQSFLIEQRENSYIYKITCQFIHSLIISQKKPLVYFLNVRYRHIYLIHRDAAHPVGFLAILDGELNQPHINI